jgi:hypothetical protein
LQQVEEEFQGHRGTKLGQQAADGAATERSDEPVNNTGRAIDFE